MRIAVLYVEILKKYEYHKNIENFNVVQCDEWSDEHGSW